MVMPLLTLPLLQSSSYVGEEALVDSPNNDALRETAIEQLGHLISIMGLHVRTYLPLILGLAQVHLPFRQ